MFRRKNSVEGKKGQEKARTRNEHNDNIDCFLHGTVSG